MSTHFFMKTYAVGTHFISFMDICLAQLMVIKLIYNTMSMHMIIILYIGLRGHPGAFREEEVLQQFQDFREKF